MRLAWLTRTLVLLAAGMAVVHTLPHGWVPSGAWAPQAVPQVPSASNPWPGWTDYGQAQVIKRKHPYPSPYPSLYTPYQTGVSHAPAPARLPTSLFNGWTQIPVLDEDNQWVAWVPEELGDYVIVRKDKLKPKAKKVEEEEEEPEPRPKPKKKVKTIVEEEAPEEEPPKPKKKTKTIVEEEASEEDVPKPKKKVKTIVEDEVPPKKTTKTVVTTEEEAAPPSTTSDSAKQVTRTEVIEQASSMPESVVVPAPSATVT